MARYTVELRDIVKSGLKIFDFEYDFFDETKKPDFEQKFINHFLFREIGCETVGRFQHYLKCKCDEVLPYYNVIFETALYEYDVKNNYNLTETFTKTNTSTKSKVDVIEQEGTNTSNDFMSGSKTSGLNSTTSHTENNEVKSVEDVKESGKLDKTNTLDVDGKKIQSDTPSGLLALTDITKNIYASRVDIEDTTNKEVDKQTTSAEKDRTNTDTTKINAIDSVSGTNSETQSGSNTSTGTLKNKTDGTQNENMSNNETYILERVGDIGVDTTPDKLKKHLEIQKILTTVYTQFFDECEDLFMGIY